MDALGPLADRSELPRRPLEAGCATLTSLTGRARRPRRPLKAGGAVYARRPDFPLLPALPRGSLWSWLAGRPRRPLNARRPLCTSRPHFPVLSALACGPLWPCFADRSRRARFSVFDFGKPSGHEIEQPERERGDLGAELGDCEIAFALPFATLVCEDLAERVGPVVRQRV
jgi:hypothetical protein